MPSCPLRYEAEAGTHPIKREVVEAPPTSSKRARLTPVASMSPKPGAPLAPFAPPLSPAKAPPCLHVGLEGGSGAAEEGTANAHSEEAHPEETGVAEDAANAAEE